MERTLLSIAVHGYGLAAVLYLVFLLKSSELLAWSARILVGGGLVLHGISLGMTVLSKGGMPGGLAQGFSLVALLLLLIFFLLDAHYRLPVAGAFLMPVALAALVPGLLISDVTGKLPPSVQQPLLPVHVGIALLGLAAFGVASGVAVMYLLMERQMKHKQFGLLFSRLPPLQLLDDLNRHLVLWGFVALSVTLVTGAFFSSDDAGFFWRWEPKVVATLVAWLGFGALMAARALAGWRGRRVAYLTMAGFCVLLVSFFSSYQLGPAAIVGVQ
jgi:ABC-type uncharacterized transport system permease subunit